eukprot:COSAG02_NODE_1256_length_13576_cov_12.901981_5_plen_389_part_00
MQSIKMLYKYSDTIEAEFKEFDVDGSGTVSEGEFALALGQLGVDVSKPPLADLTEEYTNAGRVNFVAFLRSIRRIGKTEPPPQKLNPGHPGPEKTPVPEPEPGPTTLQQTDTSPATQEGEDQQKRNMFRDYLVGNGMLTKTAQARASALVEEGYTTIAELEEMDREALQQVGFKSGDLKKVSARNLAVSPDPSLVIAKPVTPGDNSEAREQNVAAAEDTLEEDLVYNGVCAAAGVARVLREEHLSIERLGELSDENFKGMCDKYPDVITAGIKGDLQKLRDNAKALSTASSVILNSIGVAFFAVLIALCTKYLPSYLLYTPSHPTSVLKMQPISEVDTARRVARSRYGLRVFFLGVEPSTAMRPIVAEVETSVRLRLPFYYPPEYLYL